MTLNFVISNATYQVKKGSNGIPQDPKYVQFHIPGMKQISIKVPTFFKIVMSPNVKKVLEKFHFIYLFEIFTITIIFQKGPADI